MFKNLKVRILNGKITMYAGLCEFYHCRIKELLSEVTTLIEKAEHTIEKRKELLIQLENIEES